MFIISTQRAVTEVGCFFAQAPRLTRPIVRAAKVLLAPLCPQQKLLGLMQAMDAHLTAQSGLEGQLAFGVDLRHG